MKVKFTRRMVTEQQSFIELGEKEFRLGEVWEIVDALEDTDMMCRITIYNPTLADTLEELEVASRNSRGSYSRSKRFEAFQTILEKFDWSGEEREF